MSAFMKKEPPKWKHVVIRVTRQVGPDAWETYPIVMDVTPETTVKEISEWLFQHVPGATIDGCWLGL